MKKLFLLFLLLLFSCIQPGGPPSGSLTSSSYPVAIGDSWTYQVSNYPVTQTDTAVYQITGSVYVDGDSGGFPGTLYYTQTTIHGVVVDSGTILQNGTGYIYNGYNGVQTFAGSGLFSGWTFKFPIQANSSWGNEHVISSGQSMNILGHNYSNVFAISQSTITPGGIVIDTLYVAPNVGILKFYTTQLIGYQVH